ncbi:MAG: hypothetical protein WAW10_13515 [Gallionella sp.]
MIAPDGLFYASSGHGFVWAGCSTGFVCIFEGSPNFIPQSMVDLTWLIWHG